MPPAQMKRINGEKGKAEAQITIGCDLNTGANDVMPKLTLVIEGEPSLSNLMKFVDGYDLEDEIDSLRSRMHNRMAAGEGKGARTKKAAKEIDDKIVNEEDIANLKKALKGKINFLDKNQDGFLSTSEIPFLPKENKRAVQVGGAQG